MNPRERERKREKRQQQQQISCLFWYSKKKGLPYSFYFYFSKMALPNSYKFTKHEELCTKHLKYKYNM